MLPKMIDNNMFTEDIFKSQVLVNLEEETASKTFQ